MDRRHILQLAMGLTMMVPIADTAIADWAPERPINMIVPYGAGGGTDAFARAMATAAEDIFDAPIVVVNKPGSSGMVGAQAAAIARADGSNMMMTSAGSFLLNTLIRETDLDPFESFRIIGQIGELTTSIMVAANSPYQTVQDLIDAAAADPGALRWAHTGRGSFHHVAGQGFLNANSLEAQDVPFKGGAATRAAVIGGQVDFGLIGVQQARGFENEIRVLGLNSDERDGVMTDVPTLAELGHSFVAVSSPIVVFAPKDVDDSVIDGMEAALGEITASPTFAELLEARGTAPAFLDKAATETKLRTMRDSVVPIVDGLQD
ncbi:MAG: tripartite tricarboxylate transporter substrate binding protein [Pseudomonadota bacterium]